MSDETARLKLAQLVSLQELNAVTWNEALAQIDALVDLYLLGQFVDTPPAGPSDGDCYLTGGAPSGAWSGYAYKIAACLDGAWRFYTPFNGLRAYVASTKARIVYDGGNWLDTAAIAETLANKTLGATLLPGGGIIDGSGRIGAGTSSPAYVFDAVGSTSAGGSIRLTAYAATLGGGNIYMVHSRGTSASPAALTTNDAIGGFLCGGYDGSSFINNAAAFSFGCTENWSPTAHGCCFQIGVTAPGTTSRVNVLYADTTAVRPASDNTINLGSASYRWATVYAGTGTINTSGAETKTNIRPPTDAEIAVAKQLASGIRMFQFCDAVARKGEATARLHIGAIYEDVVAAFADRGLDPLRYGIVCRDKAMKTVQKARTVQDETGAQVEELYQAVEPDLDAAGAQKWTLGLRYGELAQFVIAGLAARLAALEAR